MIEHFQSQIDYAKQENKTIFMLFYFIQSPDVPNGIVLEIKLLSPNELHTFDFSNLQFLRDGSLIQGRTIPTFQYKNT